MTDITEKRLTSICLLLLLLAAGLCFQLSAFAQTALTAGMRGTIIAERAGVPIAGARVVIGSKSLQIQREAQTDTDGVFAVPGLPPGTDYEVSLSADGFRQSRLDNVALTSGETVTINASLELGGVQESVNIVDTAPLVINNAPEVSQVVDAKRITELPSNARSLNRFALLNPHVRNTAGLGSDGSGASRLSINANSFRHTHYKLDGNANYESVFANAPQQQVSLSAVQEFKILTNQYSAEYGGTTAGIISTTTKSGTDELHGEGFFFLRPSGIQAAPPVATRHVPNELTQFGGSLGGPLFSNRAAFFVNYEHSRQNRGSFIQSPTPQIYTGHFRDHLGLARFDYRLNSEHSMMLRFNANRNVNDNPNDRVSGFTQPSAAQRSLAQGAGLQFTDTTVWGRAVNEVRANYVNAIPSLTAALNPQVSIVRPNISTDGGSSYSWVRTQNYQIADQLAFQRGQHELKIGGDYTRQKVSDFSVTPLGEYRLGTGELVPGARTEYTQTFGTGFVRYGQTLASAFIQDNWRVLPRLTANLGLRYDYQSITDDRNNFAPRLGFAFNAAGDGKTIIRGGAGVFYDQYYMYITRRFPLQGLDSPTQSYRLRYGAPGAPTFPESLIAPPVGAVPVPRDFVYLPGEKLLNPYSTQFSFGVQRMLSKNWTATADLLHSRTLKQMRANDINAPAPFIRTAPGQTRSVAAADAVRPFGTNYNSVNVRKVILIENTSSSNYDALDLGLLKRYANRFQLEAHYVYSSALTYSMFFGEPDTGVPNEWRLNDRLERGASDFHQRHRFVGHGLVELPFNSQLSFVATLASGLPVNPVTGDDTNGDGYRVDRPVGFGRNSFRTPTQVNFDTSFAKKFALRENIRLEFRAEAFNLFNRSNFIKLNNIYGNGAAPLPTFLTPLAGISNSDPGRQFQFGTRLIF